MPLSCFSALALTSVLAFPAPITAQASEASPFSKLSFTDACAQAKRENKVVMIDFFTTWCGPCKILDKTTWQNKEVKAWLAQKTIALKIDVEKEEELAKKHTRGGGRAFESAVIPKFNSFDSFTETP